MPSIMWRSFAEQSLGVTWPPEIAYRRFGTGAQGGHEDVTWEDIKNERRRRHAETMRRIRGAEPARITPAYLWTFLVPWTIPYGGWHCYIMSHGGPGAHGRPESQTGRLGVRWRYHEDLAKSLMTTFAEGLLPIHENWRRWKEAFARSHPRRHVRDDRRRAGSVLGWWDREARRFTIAKPGPQAQMP